MDYSKIKNLTYRRAVTGIIIDSQYNFLIVQNIRYSHKDWKFSGGGIEMDESPEEALLRELEEELGTENFTILEKSNFIEKYKWPKAIVQRSLESRGITFKGQSVIQFLVKYTSNKQDIKFDHNELRAIKWVKYSELKKHFHFPNQMRLTNKTLRAFKTKLPI